MQKVPDRSGLVSQLTDTTHMARLRSSSRNDVLQAFLQDVRSAHSVSQDAR
jgi:hypothetical protein